MFDTALAEHVGVAGGLVLGGIEAVLCDLESHFMKPCVLIVDMLFLPLVWSERG